MRKALLIIVILAALIVLTVFAPRFLFQKARINNELNNNIEGGVRLGISLDDVNIVDYRGRWHSLYVKLELPQETYDHVKQRFLLLEGTVSNKDFAEEIQDEESGYIYDGNHFYSLLRLMDNVKIIGEFDSMKLNDYEELFIVDTTYGKTFFLAGTTGSRHHILIKENGGECYLYIIRY